MIYNAPQLGIPGAYRLTDIDPISQPLAHDVARLTWETRREPDEPGYDDLCLVDQVVFTGDIRRQVNNDDIRACIGAFDGPDLIAVGIANIDFARPEAVLEILSVDAEHRAAGLGRSLLRCCELQARFIGHRVMTLHTNLSSVPFYLKQGYVPHPSSADKTFLTKNIAR